MPILKLDKDDPQRELEFDIEFALKQDPSERLDQWLEWNISMLKFARQQQHGNKDTPPLTKRT